MSWSWLWLIVDLFALCISINQSRYIRLPPVNCSELSAIGTPITQLLNVLPSSNWAFAFLTRTSVVSYFLLDDLKGTITVKRPLDREDLCRLGLCSCVSECSLKLEVNALSDTYTHIINVPIVILDENDNFCYFSSDIYYLNVSESVRVNSRLVLPIAHDPDQSPNNIQSYSILPNNETQFRLDSQLTPSLIIAQHLDRELRDRYHFDFCAYEGLDSQQRSCCTKLVLSIIDVNDNAAKFQFDQQSPLTITVSELAPVHTELIQMKATDADDGLNGEIRYAFSKWTQNDLSISPLFYLNPDNGSIILMKSLDYEQRNNYELQIQAKDRGPNAIPTYATVIIQVIDENDCSPEIFTFSPADVQLVNNSIYIVENMPVGTPILYATVSDRDSGINGRVTLELLSTSASRSPFVRLEKVTDNTYSLRIDTALDREQQHLTYTFTLVASDHGQPKRSLESLFELHLIDVNDCSPTFLHASNYTFSVDENNEQNLILTTIETFDPDLQDHVTVQLQFDSKQAYEHLFKLNEKNQLLITESLDHERRSSYEFSVVAEDAAGHRTSMPIVVHVNNLNDNPVKFTSNFTRFEMEENQAYPIVLGHILAEDADQSPSLLYSVHPEDLHRVRAWIHLDRNGTLFTSTSFDREQINRIQFRAVVTDSLHTDEMSIEIVILDQNDNTPTLTSPSPFCVIHNATRTDSSIRLDLEGNDPDENENGEVSFSLGNPSSSDITLLPNGTLLILGKLQEYQFDVHLKDHATSNPRSSLVRRFRLLIVSNDEECQARSTRSPMQLDQKTFIYFTSVALLCLACLTVFLVLVCCCYFIRQQQRKRKLSSSHKATANLTPSFSSSLNDEAENDTLLLSSPSPQFTAMTTVSTSTTSTHDSTRLTTFIDRPTNKSSSLSSASSSTYVKMSRSFDDEML